LFELQRSPFPQTERRARTRDAFIPATARSIIPRGSLIAIRESMSAASRSRTAHGEPPISAVQCRTLTEHRRNQAPVRDRLCRRRARTL